VRCNSDSEKLCPVTDCYKRKLKQAIHARHKVTVK
jgi:hypothetical protein